MTDIYSTPDDNGEPRASELHSSLGERLGAQAGEAFMGGSRAFTRMREFGQAESGEETLGSQIGRLQNGEDLNDLFQPQEHDGTSFGGPRPPVDVPIADAKAQIKQKGLDGTLALPDQPTIRQGVLDLMLQHAQERRDYDAAVARGPQGFFPGALGMATEIGAGMIDPVNAMAFSIPVLGEARWGMLLARAGDSLAARAGVRALQGGLQGAVGSTALVPGDWWLHTQDGQDYTMADALKSVVMGAGMGAAAHAGIGAFGDVRARMRGQALPGSPEDLVQRGLMAGTHVPGAALESEGLPAEEVPGLAPSGESIYPPLLSLRSTPEAAPPHPADILADLPPAAREDVTRAAMADVIAGRPVRAAEMLQEAAKEDPRIAESVGGVEAFHGSAADFDRFDSSKIGAGEGAQARAYGLYFAENEDVAQSYKLAMEDRHLHPDQEGLLYKVHIAPHADEFLDWETDLSAQPAGQKILASMDPKFKEQLEGFLEEHDQPALEDLTGGMFHRLLERYSGEGELPGIKQEFNPFPRKEASQYIESLGVPGVRFLDQKSRSDRAYGNLDAAPVGEKPTRNYVVFNDKDIRITHKNGQEVGLDEMKAARPEVVPGPAPGTLHTGRPNVDAALADPIVADAIANGPVNRANDVPYEAGASAGSDPTTNLDRHLPRLAELPSGKSFDPAVPAKIHEQIEKRAMEVLIARKKAEVGRELTQKEIDSIYEIAHHEYAEVAEDAWYRSQGLDINEVNAWWAKQDKITEHEHPANPPPNLYRKPYPHNVVEGVKHEAKGEAAEWPTTVAVEGGNSAGAGDNVVRVRARKAGGPAARPEATRSLFEHIAANGGLREDDPMIADVRGSLGRDNHFVPGFGNLIRKPKQISTAAARSGASAPMSLDQARESAVHHGYLEDQGEHSGGLSTSTVRDLLDAIDHEARGNRIYRPGVEPPKSARDQAKHEHELNGAMEKGLGDYGVDTDRIPSKTRARTLEIMDKEGVTDPLDAYERAVMEETQHGAETGEHERIADQIPGWDVPDDAGAASGAGAAAGADQSGAGGPARDAGEGDRAAGRAGATATAGGVDRWREAVKANRAGGIADWRKLETPHGAADDPDTAAASKAAEKTPEPQSVEPTKAVSAAQAEAAKADQLLADILPSLSEAERKIFETALAGLKDDAEAREQIVRDGATCLAAAVA